MKAFIRTKIVATIGPACADSKTLGKMIDSGLRVARLNFSHGDHKSHAILIKKIRAAAKKAKVELAILQDLQGPRIRVGNVAEQGIPLSRGSKVALVGDLHHKIGVLGYQTIPIQYTELYRDVKKGNVILIEDGTIQLKVTGVRNRVIYCKTKIAGVIKSHKGINVPGVTLTVDVITAKDKKDIVFGQKHEVDYVALSFVRDGNDIKQLKRLIRSAQKRGTKIATKTIAKIERREALVALDSILDEVDGIMVARGDLGLEIPSEQVPLWQKNLISKCLARAKPVIVATQMLDSMIRNPQPTRAEVSDVANAVIDHTDAIMLSGESATGKYPIEAVSMMSKIASVTEESNYDDYLCGPKNVKGRQAALALAACHLHMSVGAKAMIVFTRTGDTARQISRHRPELPIIALTTDKQTQRQLALSWGVIARQIAPNAKWSSVLQQAMKDLVKMRIIKKGDPVLIISTEPSGKVHETTQLKVHLAGEPLV